MDKLNQAMNQLSETRRADFNKLFVKEDLTQEFIEKLNTDFENDESLDQNQKGRLRGLRNDLVKYLVKQSQIKQDKESIINEMKDILKRIMKPASHASIVPLYEGEFTRAIASVQRLKELLTRLVPD